MKSVLPVAVSRWNDALQTAQETLSTNTEFQKQLCQIGARTAADV